MVKIVFIHLKVALLKLIEGLQILVRYYTNPAFLFCDLLHRAHYVFVNPYQMSKRFLKERGENDLDTYGETPLTTFDKISRECGLLSKDIVYDLGCGTGRGAFWLHAFVHCEVVGVDHNPYFIQKANHILNVRGCQKLTFHNVAMEKINLDRATVIYLSEPYLKEEILGALMKKFQHLPKGTKIITVSSPLPENRYVKIAKTFEGKFFWGKTEIFLHICN